MRLAHAHAPKLLDRAAAAPSHRFPLTPGAPPFPKGGNRRHDYLNTMKLLPSLVLAAGFSFASFIHGTLAADTPAVFNVRDFGATGDGKTPDTKAIDAAIAACAKAGGGTVLFPAGIYLSGTIHLQGNHLTLNVVEGARILGQPNDVNAYDQPEPNEWDKYQDYGHSHFHNALMWGAKIDGLTITGGGVIHGGGITWRDPQKGGGDKILSLTESKNIKVSGVSLLQGGHFVMLLNDCENIEISRVLIRTPRDAIDLMGCRNVLIEDCTMRDFEHVDYDRDIREGERLYAGDDCIGIKSDYALGRRLLTENIVVRRCKLSSGCNPIQFGSETTGDFRNVHISDIEIVHADKAGIGVTSNDGATIEDVTFKNITMARAACPIYINVNGRLRTPEKVTPGHIRNLTFENITAVDSYGYSRKVEGSSVISGLPGYLVENVVFKNVKLSVKGGGKKEEGELVPHYPRDYSPGSFGRRPAYGFYVRNAKNIEFHNVEFTFEKTDLRPALIFQNVDGVTLADVHAQRAPDAGEDVVLRKSTGVKTSGSTALTTAERTTADPQFEGPRQPKPKKETAKL
jgi:polygalacturonase